MRTVNEARPTDLVHLAPEQAVQRHLDAFNYRCFRGLCWLATLVAIGFALWLVGSGEYGRLWLPLVNLLLVRAAFWAAARPASEGRFQLVVLGYLVPQLGLVALYAPTLAQGLHLLGVVAPLALLPFRFRVLSALAVFSLFGIAGVSLDLIAALGDRPLPVRAVLLQGSLSLVCLFVHIGVMRTSYRRFMREFQVAASRHRDRQRMREELDYARQVQLRMLPQGDPKLEHLDVSAISLPATEVGGDYWEYFRPGSSSFTIAIGDVAGHGLASGLLLSGIRSCLHLLKDESLGPCEILDRLNRMVGETTSRRMFITLLYAEIDWGERRVRLSSAGHPPLLHVDGATGAATELGNGAPPLGTRLGVSYAEAGRTFAPGDVMLLYTDGLTELMGRRHEPYGVERLVQRVAENRLRSSREIRESVLTDLWNFKGDAEQLDDLTLVVVKVPAAGGPAPAEPE